MRRRHARAAAAPLAEMCSSLRASLLFSAAVLSPRSQANMLDLVQPLKLRPSECSFGCARWTDLAADGSTANQTAVDESWAAGSAPPGADNLCAQQGRSLRATVGENYTDGWNNSSPWTPDMTMPGAFGAFCYCKNASATPGSTLWAHCQSPRLTPQQVNIQLAGTSSVVVSFVTFGDVDVHGTCSAGTPDCPPPVVAVWEAGGTPPGPNFSGHTVSGNSTVYDTDAVPYNKAGRDAWSPEPERRYSMHFVRLAGLKPGTTYEYRVRSDKDETWSLWSGTYKFRFGDMKKFAMFGDMGVFEWNNMANLLADTEAEDIDAVLMLGDHCCECEPLPTNSVHCMCVCVCPVCVLLSGSGYSKLNVACPCRQPRHGQYETR